jgi:hypothetical protein
MIERVISQPSLAAIPTIDEINANPPATSAFWPGLLQKQQNRPTIAITAAIEKNTMVKIISALDALCALDAVLVEANY